MIYKVGNKYKMFVSGDILKLIKRQKSGKDFVLTFEDENGNPHKIKESIVGSLNLRDL